MVWSIAAILRAILWIFQTKRAWIAIVELSIDWSGDKFWVKIASRVIWIRFPVVKAANFVRATAKVDKLWRRRCFELFSVVIERKNDAQRCGNAACHCASLPSTIGNRTAVIVTNYVADTRWRIKITNIVVTNTHVAGAVPRIKARVVANVDVAHLFFNKWTRNDWNLRNPFKSLLLNAFPFMIYLLPKKSFNNNNNAFDLIFFCQYSYFMRKTKGELRFNVNYLFNLRPNHELLSKQIHKKARDSLFEFLWILYLILFSNHEYIHKKAVS